MGRDVCTIFNFANFSFSLSMSDDDDGACKIKRWLVSLPSLSFRLYSEYLGGKLTKKKEKEIKKEVNRIN